MKSKEYNKLVNKYNPNEKRGLNLLKAFIIGGLFGLLGNFLIDFYSTKCGIPSNEASIYMITTLIFIACLCTALGFFDNFVKFGRMGVIIPITGFAHSMQSAALDYKNEGFIYGFGANIFKLAGSVLLYGIASAYIFSFIRYLIGG